jgi:hypothetical protein
VDDLKEDEYAVAEERACQPWMPIQYEAGGWSTRIVANYTLRPWRRLEIVAPSETTDLELMQYLKANYDAELQLVVSWVSLRGTHVTDAAVTALANTCPGLQHIDLDRTQVTDAAATALANACPGLQSIHLRNSQVTHSLAKWWDNDTTTDGNCYNDGTIADFRWEMRRVQEEGQGQEEAPVASTHR